MCPTCFRWAAACYRVEGLRSLGARSWAAPVDEFGAEDRRRTGLRVLAVGHPAEQFPSVDGHEKSVQRRRPVRRRPSCLVRSPYRRPDRLGPCWHRLPFLGSRLRGLRPCLRRFDADRVVPRSFLRDGSHLEEGLPSGWSELGVDRPIFLAISSTVIPSLPASAMHCMNWSRRSPLGARLVDAFRRRLIGACDTTSAGCRDGFPSLGSPRWSRARRSRSSSSSRIRS